jgi:DNA helicase-2/ATP-dependent DNA helicase PcrA
LDDLPEELLNRVEPSTPETGAWEGDTAVAWPSPTDTGNPYRVGTKVRHPIFGLGTVKNCEGTTENRKVTVAFQNAGLKKLVAKISNLTILG